MKDDTKMTQDSEDAPLKFAIGLMIKHPTMDPARISMELGLQPWHSWKAGEPRVTPVGKRLPGVNPTSYWVSREEVTGKRLFFENVLELVSRLEPSSQFIAEIVDGGGFVSITVQLPGERNIGDSMDWPGLARIAALKIELGIEVFPDWN